MDGGILSPVGASAPASVYLYYDKRGLLIYVGITSRGVQRQRQHNADKEWWKYVTRQEVAHFQTRKAALLRERELIQKHRPPFNRQHNPTYKYSRRAYEDILQNDRKPVPRKDEPDTSIGSTALALVSSTRERNGCRVARYQVVGVRTLARSHVPKPALSDTRDGVERAIGHMCDLSDAEIAIRFKQSWSNALPIGVAAFGKLRSDGRVLVKSMRVQKVFTS